MEENKEQIDIIEYMPENFENISDYNKENMFNKEKEYEYNQNLKELDFISDSLKEKEKPKGYTRIFRNIIKKKSEIMKNILKKRFTKWRKDTMKGLIVKKTIIVRISVSREKDYKDRYKNKLRLDKENEKEKSKSTNKNVIKSHNFIQPEINSYNIVREKIDNIDNQKDNTKENLNIDNTVNNENTDIQIDNITNNFTIEKNNTININNEDNILKDNEKDNESNKDISNENLKMKKNKLINISNEKPKNTAQIYNIYATNTKPDSTNNINNKFTKVNNITQISRTYNKNDKQKIQESNKKNENNLNKNQKYNASNVAIISSSYTTKNNKNNKEQKETTKNNALINKNEMKGYYIKYDGFHENKNIYSSIPIPVKTVNLNEKEYNPYRNNNNNKKTFIKSIPDNKNNSDINLFSRRTHQINNNKNTNNMTSFKNISNIEKYNNYTSKIGTNSSIRQKLNSIENANLRGGVTTVIQHYGGRRKKYENYDQNSFKKQNN
jgi:hypothetical protein